MSELSLESMMVGDILARWPDTATAFNRHKMACPGCAMAPFMTLSEACKAYGLKFDGVAESVRRSIAPLVSAEEEDAR